MSSIRSILKAGIVTSVMLICSVALALSQQPPSIPEQPKPATVTNEDMGAWRREPFLVNTKKGERLPDGRSTPLKKIIPVSKQQELQDFNLQGIMQADKAFHALVNGRTVKTGDIIAGVTIREISRFRVVVLNESREKIIYDIYQGRIDRGKQ